MSFMRAAASAVNRGASKWTGLGTRGNLALGAQAGLQIAQGAMERAAARRNARLMRQRAEAEAAQARREGRAIIGQGRAKRGASGVQVESGTAMDVTLAQAEALEMRALRAAHPFLAEAAAQEVEGTAALWGGLMSAGSSILGAGLRNRYNRRTQTTRPTPKKIPKRRRPLGVPGGRTLPPVP